MQSYKEIITCGIFNVDFLNHAGNSAQSLMNIMHSYYMYPLIGQPTRE